MFDARLLYGDRSPVLQIYGPWFLRGGDNAVFSIDFVRGTATVILEVLTTALADAGDGTLLHGSFSASSSGQGSGLFSGFKDLVRYRYSVTDATSKWALSKCSI